VHADAVAFQRLLLGGFHQSGANTVSGHRFGDIYHLQFQPAEKTDSLHATHYLVAVVADRNDEQARVRRPEDGAS
jgi:hypothetical protein